MFVVLLVFIFGLCAGSFVNALEYRAEKNISIRGRSFCPQCKHSLHWCDLVPVASWVLLGGKCRYCNKKISIQYPIVEILTGIIFVGIGLKAGYADIFYDFILNSGNFTNFLLISAEFVLVLAVSTILILLALYDAKTGYILSKIAYLGILIVLFYHVLNFFGNDLQSFWLYLLPFFLSALVFAGFFFFVSSFSKEKYLGAGDAEIAFLIGFILGWPDALASFALAVIIGSIFSLILIAKKKATLKSEIPFGPFLVLGAFLAYFFNDILINLYVRIFLGA